MIWWHKVKEIFQFLIYWDGPIMEKFIKEASEMALTGTKLSLLVSVCCMVVTVGCACKIIYDIASLINLQIKSSYLNKQYNIQISKN